MTNSRNFWAFPAAVGESFCHTRDRSTHTPVAVSVMAVLVALGALTACGQANDTGLFEVRASSSTAAQPAAQPPDGSPVEAVPPGDGARLLVTIGQVRVHLSSVDDLEHSIGEPDQPPVPGKKLDDSRPEDGAGWYTVFSGARQLDLFDTRAASIFLGSVAIPEGKVNQLRLVLSDDVVYVTAAGASSVRCPSCGQSGLEIPLHPAVTLAPGQHLSATLAFGGDHVLWKNPQGYVLSPVIHAEVGPAQ